MSVTDDGQESPTSKPSPLPASLAELRAEVLAGFSPAADLVVPDVRELAASFAYEMVWSRPQLAPRDRSIATIAALAALKSNDQLKMHVLRGLANGISKDEIGEILTQLIPYLGFPLAVSAAATVADLLDRVDLLAT